MLKQDAFIFLLSKLFRGSKTRGKLFHNYQKLFFSLVLFIRLFFCLFTELDSAWKFEFSKQHRGEKINLVLCRVQNLFVVLRVHKFYSSYFSIHAEERCAFVYGCGKQQILRFQFKEILAKDYDANARRCIKIFTLKNMKVLMNLHQLSTNWCCGVVA